MSRHAEHCLNMLGCVTVIPATITAPRLWVGVEWIVRVPTGYAPAGTFWFSPS